VVDGEVEAVAAGLRGMRALCSSERDAIGLEARNRVIALANVRTGQGSVAAGRAAVARGGWDSLRAAHDWPRSAKTRTQAPPAARGGAKANAAN
jgi:hypothetical protein